MDTDEYLYFIDRAFEGMLAALNELGDELANQAPADTNLNTPWAITYHCTQVASYWIGHLIAGRAIERDRDAEFNAGGRIEELDHVVANLRRQLRADLAHFNPTAPLRETPPASYDGPARDLTPVGVLLHVLEELAQHHGQIQITHDVLVSATAGRTR